MKVTALISGGKDSLFSILHCMQNGHDVIALANLHPDNTRDEDIDSFMYQTIGHKVIPLYQQVLGIPLYRQAITGSAVETGKDYRHNESLDHADETESLTLLLKRIKSLHPDLEAVSTGAILSDYQRSRVESVCVRLGLKSLAYLWQWSELPPFTSTSLLEDMQQVMQDARIIKTASGSLDEKHLGLNVAAIKTIAQLSLLASGREEDRGASIGEGGEYETLAIDGPSPLWKQRIELEKTRSINTGGGSFILAIDEASCCAKALEDSTSSTTALVRIPSVLEDQFADLLAALDKEASVSRAMSSTKAPMTSKIDGLSKTSATGTGSTSSLRLMSLTFGLQSSTETSETINAQIVSILSRLKQELADRYLTPDDIILSTILLRDMRYFAQMNTQYGSLFERPLPPARVTIGAGAALPDDELIRVTILIPTQRTPDASREGLHVQSISYWAPANIGPYSQAVTTPMEPFCASRRVLIAGQIPLIPASMQLLSTSFHEQTILALQHLWRIGRRMRVSSWAYAIAYISANDASEAHTRAKVVGYAWRMAHARKVSDDSEEAEEVDIGEQRLFRRWAGLQDSSRVGPLTLPRWDDVEFVSDTVNPPCFTVRVQALPRDASVESTSQGLDSRDGQSIVVSSREVRLGSKSFMTQGIPRPCALERIVQSIIETKQSPSTEEITVWTAVSEGRMGGVLQRLIEEGVTVIPVYEAFDQNGDELDFVVHSVSAIG